jgi:predicted nucleotidyltransferase
MSGGAGLKRCKVGVGCELFGSRERGTASSDISLGWLPRGGLKAMARWAVRDTAEVELKRLAQPVNSTA